MSGAPLERFVGAALRGRPIVELGARGAATECRPYSRTLAAQVLCVHARQQLMKTLATATDFVVAFGAGASVSSQAGAKIFVTAQ